MAIVPYDPFRHPANMRKDFDRFFTDLPGDFDNDHHYNGIRVDVYENEHEIIATCDIPGIENKDNITIDIENNTLSVSGSINKMDEVKEEHMYRKERYAGHFHRSVSLPVPVSEEGVKATYWNGVLEVIMPKLLRTHKKKIDVDFH